MNNLLSAAFTLLVLFGSVATHISNVRIVNGLNALDGEFPYQSSLRRQTIHICGASVLDDIWAITAAHCIDGHEKEVRLYTMRMGSIQRSDGGTIVNVRGMYKHPNYNSNTMNFDVALVHMVANSVRFGTEPHVAPISLPEIGSLIEDDTPATVSGWGHLQSTEQVLSPVLKYTTVFTVNQQRCQSDMSKHGGITDAMFCAAARNTDACQGDSGGPINANNTLIGIVSWGIGCADPYYPGVYTRLAYPTIRSWIRLLTKL